MKIRDSKRRMKSMTAAYIVLFSVLLMPVPCAALTGIGVETGIVYSGYNEARIPNKTGTLISLSEDLHIDGSAFLRMTAFHEFGGRHRVELLFAPLSLDAKGRIDKDVNFEGKLFPAGSDIDAIYRFNSYRIRYRYTVHDSKRLKIGLGVTAKIRDAEISLASQNIESAKKNVGFVPLIGFRIDWSIGGAFSLLFEGDALAAPQGRAEDVLAALSFRVRDGLQVHAGYRILEGGADVDEVYNFALLHYLTVGAEVSF
jgi:hypothetical protein